MGSPRAGQIRHIVQFCHAGDGMERRTNRTPPRKPDSGAAEGLRSPSGEVLGEARGQVDDPDLNDATAVHELRKGIKPWPPLLPRFEPLIDARPHLPRAQAPTR